jgi:hypothetical protein
MIWHRNQVRATKAEQERIARMLSLGCCACAQEMLTYDDWPLADPECQHIIEGNKRLGHLYTIGLCAGHHRGEWSKEQRAFILALRLALLSTPVSLSAGSKPFTARYGTQRELWGGTQIMLGLPDEWPKSKAYRSEADRVGIEISNKKIEAGS